MGRKCSPVEDRLWQRADKSAGPEGCWLWTGARTEKGYGKIIAAGYFDTIAEAGEAARLKRIELFKHSDADQRRTA
jgi:hypothetical protein